MKTLKRFLTIDKILNGLSYSILISIIIICVLMLIHISKNPDLISYGF